MEWRFWARTRPAHLNAFEDDCEAIEPLLSLYGDGMASAAEARLVEAHLPGCESCRESLAWMQATRRALSNRPVQSPPPDLHARIAEAIAASEAAPLRLRPARTFATRPAFAAAASLAAVGLFLGYSLTHLPHPGTSVKPVPQTVAVVPQTGPSVLVSPTKPAAPSVTVKKPKSAPLMANRDVTPEDALPAPEAVPAPRVPTKSTERRVLPVLPATAPAVVLRQKPVAPHPTNLIAVKPAVIVKHTPAPLPTKEPPLVASTNVKTKEPDVVVLPSKVTPQESPAVKEVASATPSEPRMQTVDYLREVNAGVKARQAHFTQTVGTSLRGLAATTHTFENEGGATRVANMVGYAPK